MPEIMGFLEASRILSGLAEPVGAEDAPLWECPGRVAAEDIYAAENVPAFDRSPLDGYAFFSGDSEGASKDSPVTLEIVGEVAAGFLPTGKMRPGAAYKILTGAPIPEGCDAVTKFELTKFTDTAVTLFAPARPGDNIVRAGEDAARGELLIPAGSVIDAGAAGSIAAQGAELVRVYKRPRIGIISTGSELQEPGEALAPGKIYNSSRFALRAALWACGCESEYIGIAADRAEDIAALIKKAAGCDAVIITGGASVGDYDLTPAAMELAGARVLFDRVDMKPGGACVYSVLGSRLLCGLSGNPASALTNFYEVLAPALRRLRGLSEIYPRELTLYLASDFNKRSPKTRLLRGRLELSSGRAELILPPKQGNVAISSLIGCDAAAIVPAGSGPLPSGTELKGFLL